MTVNVCPTTTETMSIVPTLHLEPGMSHPHSLGAGPSSRPFPGYPSPSTTDTPYGPPPHSIQLNLEDALFSLLPDCLAHFQLGQEVQHGFHPVLQHRSVTRRTRIFSVWWVICSTTWQASSALAVNPSLAGMSARTPLCAVKVTSSASLYCIVVHGKTCLCTFSTSSLISIGCMAVNINL
ncbi:uncharacterized protein LAESUDRAFT_760754 [Laetiporus sulphureus 93-53]|uniref:Uncharacterized protein n=1 Tax=Laetiporus sulphureus 93-53 TaxID=1314785 RepID=A0A165DEM1_9APHY|nr:uncharacterized protein LAESUDRAFT_760754 [Laetiporus sulphureus 93-53]KZT04715.1 hypothetical protein LAESUDRAFT_760754 [Laetiporus sulphureus 93-53]